jgi:hypothetical protein
MTLSAMRQYVAYELGGLRDEERRIERDLMAANVRLSTLARAVANLDRRADALDKMLTELNGWSASRVQVAA